MDAPGHKIFHYQQLANEISNHYDWRDFPDLFDGDGDELPELHGKWYLAIWRDNCVTCYHLADADIEGPFGSAEEAELEMVPEM